MPDQSLINAQAERVEQEHDIHKRDLLTILIICVLIGILLYVLYYFEQHNQILTKAGDYITNNVL
jgi:hypothetical protein